MRRMFRRVAAVAAIVAVAHAAPRRRVVTLDAVADRTAPNGLRIVERRRGTEHVPEARPTKASGAVQGPMLRNTVATATYAAVADRVGWSELNIKTSPAHTDLQQAYAAGYVEAHHTYEDTVSLYKNLYAWQKDPASMKLQAWLHENLEWVTAQANAQAATSNYWMQIALGLKQMDGMVDGYAAYERENGKAPYLNRLRVTLLSSVGDLFDLIPAMKYYTPSNATLATVMELNYAREARFGKMGAGAAGSKAIDGTEDWRRMSKIDYDLWFARRTHCSALVTVGPGSSDLFFGHTTWSHYNQMLRIFKHYNFNFRSSVSKTVSFSGYPGTLSSVDDFYMTDQKLAVTETSFAVFNHSIYKRITPRSVLYGHRVMAANRMATSGEEWGQWFAQQNSGTYNNQWIVVDNKRFVQNQKAQGTGLVTVLEQLPGVIAGGDRTDVLNSQGYWPSYNVPSIKEVFDLAGYPEAVRTQGPEMNSYNNCVRAKLFRRLAPNTFDMPAMMATMQHNHYKTDVESQGNPIYAIAARGDLSDVANPPCFGGLDTKVSSWTMMNKGRQVLAYSGPTPQAGAFDFRKVKSTTGTVDPSRGCEHNGMPHRYDFPWRHFTPAVQAF